MIWRAGFLSSLAFALAASDKSDRHLGRTCQSSRANRRCELPTVARQNHNQIVLRHLVGDRGVISAVVSHCGDGMLAPSIHNDDVARRTR